MTNQFSRNSNYRFILSAALVIVGFIQFLILHIFGNVQLDIALTDSIIHTAIFVLLALSIWYPINYMEVEKRSVINIVFNNFLIIVFTSLLWSYSSNVIVTSLFPNYEIIYSSTLPWRFTVGTLLIIIIIILDYAIIFYKNLTEKTISETKSNLLIAEAELKSLKYQINPHFIFNSLNSISSLTISNPEKAQEMAINLSEFLRKILAVNDIKRISLDEELKNIELYLKIEKVRFEDSLEFSLNLSKECKNVLLPNMILQPLIENCIKHGVYESSETVKINLSCEQKSNYLEIIISNNYDSSFANKSGNGIGLQNINSRLKLIYNKPDLISIRKKDGIFTVILLIPIEEYLDETSM